MLEGQSTLPRRVRGKVLSRVGHKPKRIGSKGSLSIQNKAFQCQVCEIFVNSETQLKQVRRIIQARKGSSFYHHDRLYVVTMNVNMFFPPGIQPKLATLHYFCFKFTAGFCFKFSYCGFVSHLEFPLLRRKVLRQHSHRSSFYR